MKQDKKEYTAPALTVVTFKAEKGYALSGLGLFDGFLLDNDDSQSQDHWQDDNTYLGSSWQ